MHNKNDISSRCYYATILLITLLVLSGCQQQKYEKDQSIGDEIPHRISSGFRVEILDSSALDMIDPAASIKVIAEGFTWTEGPLFIPDSNYLLFSDIPENKIYRWQPGKGIDVFLEPSGYSGQQVFDGSWEKGSNGLLLTPQGYLILCQHGDRRIAVSAKPLHIIEPKYITLADRYEGKRFNSPNDAVLHSNGDLYFTDPAYGLPNRMQDSSKELDFQGIYRVKPNGTVDLISKELKNPNGIALSPDETKLYVANSNPNHPVWMVYDLDDAGLAKSQKIFYDSSIDSEKYPGSPDGMVVAKNGFLFATGPGGVWVFHPDGRILARIYTGQKTSNCTLNPDQSTLYLTADDYILKVNLK